MQATAEVTGSVANLQLIGTGKPYIALTQADAAIDAVKGQDKFSGKPIPVRTLAVLYPNRMHVVSIEGTGVTKIADLKGKRVSTGSGGSATEVFAFRVIEAAGPRQGQGHEARAPRRGRIGERAEGPQDRRLLLGGWPADRGGDRSRQLSRGKDPHDRHRPSGAGHAKKHGNIYIKDVIEKSVYKGMEADNQAATVTNLLVVHQNMDDKTAYNIVKAVFDHRDELIRVHKEAENIKLENQKTELRRFLAPRGDQVLRRKRRQDQLSASAQPQPRRSLPAGLLL